MELVSRFFQSTTHHSYFLFGPRGVGKSTLVKKFHPKVLVLDLLEADLRLKYMANPERLKDWVTAYPPGTVFIIDEIQKVPELLSIVHILIEMKQDWLFVLTGSSARKLKRAEVDLLAGRALLKHLHPFMITELSQNIAHFKFDLDYHLQFGMLPLVINSKSPKQTLKTYIALYMQEAVLMEGLVRRIDHFSRFMNYAI